MSAVTQSPCCRHWASNTQAYCGCFHDYTLTGTSQTCRKCSENTAQTLQFVSFLYFVLLLNMPGCRPRSRSRSPTGTSSSSRRVRSRSPRQAAGSLNHLEDTSTSTAAVRARLLAVRADIRAGRHSKEELRELGNDCAGAQNTLRDLEIRKSIASLQPGHYVQWRSSRTRAILVGCVTKVMIKNVEIAVPNATQGGKPTIWKVTASLLTRINKPEGLSAPLTP